MTKTDTADAAALASAKPAQAGEYEGLAKFQDDRAKGMRAIGLIPDAELYEASASAIRTLEAERDALREMWWKSTQDGGREMVRAAAAEARALSLETRLAAMGEALKDARDNGLIHWEVQSHTGGVNKTKMLDRIDAILSTEASHEQR